VKSYDPDFFTTPLMTYEFEKTKDLKICDFDWAPAANTVVVAARGGDKNSLFIIGYPLINLFVIN
jgi:hypothetical protein